ncbi:MAG: efflux RND transporter periplasmic adaptor subunit [bacterium]
MNARYASTKRGIISAVVVLIVIAAIAAAGFVSCSHRHGGEGHEAKTVYTCPMHPQYRSDKPGTCPICGMTLVPVKEEPQGTKEGQDKEARAAVEIDSERQQRIGVTTAKVATGPAVAEIRAAGRVAFDPDLSVAQREYIEARRAGDKEIVDAARQRLTLMGMGKDQIDALSSRSKPDVNLVLPGKTAWVYAAVYERELPQVHSGDAAMIVLPDGSPVGSGTIRAIDPVLDQQTRTSRVRIEVDNSQGKLKPNMFVTALLKRNLGEKLLVPKSAVIDSGMRKLVFMVHEGGHFMPRDVVLGPELADSYVVESGLAAGEVVATSALFLIDSESQLKAAAGAMSGHKHD